MVPEEIEAKKIPGLKETVTKEIIGNAIVMTIIVLASWGLAFGTWGKADGIGTFLGYIACMVPFFTVMQSYVPLSQKRADFARGKWELKDDEKDLPAESCGINIWHWMLPRALVYGFGTMILLVTAIKLSGWQPTPLPIVLIVLAANITTTTLLIKRYLPMVLLSHAKGIGACPVACPRPLTGYWVVEHAVPFILLQGYINACVANRAYHFEAAKAGLEYVPTHALLPDVFITFVLLALLQWMFSNALTRGDVRLGKVPVDRLKNISGWAASGTIFLGGIMISGVYWLILTLGGVHGLSIGMATLFKMAIVVLSIVFGAWIGICWGGTREAAEMRG
ncbi:MAG: hypothetical protein L6301_00665 [Desulfobacteraceae bacterium]|nr:hypothetical protein [Desulfobacteraceae bacterium]